MKILVVDSQGGGLGKIIIEKLHKELPHVTVIAAGTNSLATNTMLKAGASSAATGENAIVFNAFKADIIMGGIGIIAANSMMGEVSPSIAKGISECDALKILIPMNKCSYQIAGVKDEPIPIKVDNAVEMVKDFMKKRDQ